MRPIEQRQRVDHDTFHQEVVPAGQPVVIRDLVGDWPIVQQARESDAATCQYLEAMDAGTSVYTIAAAPEADGRFFYNADLRGLNFKQAQIPFGQVLSQFQAFGAANNAPALAVQAMPVRDALPRFETENSMPLLNDVPPTMWLGNRARVAPHFDVHQNLACVVTGRRQFVLFPPEQLSHLYLGPALGAPGGVPVSLVDVWKPDLTRFPRFAKAQETALEATLEPGDAIYIPSLWWHGVASLEPLNILVNYWWAGISPNGVSPHDSLLHAMLSIKDLNDQQRTAWRAYFEHYVFGDRDNLSGHLPAELEDVVTQPSAKQLALVKNFLRENLDE